MEDDIQHSSGIHVRQPTGPPKGSLRTVSIMETLSELATGTHGKPLLRKDASRFHHPRSRRNSEKQGEFSDHIMSVSERLLAEVLRDRNKSQKAMQSDLELRWSGDKYRLNKRGRSVDDILRTRAPPSLPPPEVPYIGSLERRRRRRLGGKMGFFVNPRRGETDWEQDDDDDDIGDVFSDCELKAKSTKGSVSYTWKDRSRMVDKTVKNVTKHSRERGSTPDWLKRILDAAAKGQLAKLQRAVTSLEPTLVRTLVDHRGNNLAHILASRGHTAALSWLVTAMGENFLPSVFETNDKGFSPVLCAVKDGQLETVRWIVENTPVGSMLGTSDTEKSILHVAVKADKMDVLQWLFESCPLDVNIKDRHGDTPLHIAARKGFIASVALLLQRGANISIKNFFGLRALDVAARLNHKGVVHMLRLHEAALGLSSDLYESTVELEDIKNDHSALKSYFRDVLNVGKRLAKERDELCRELGRLHEDVTTLHEGLLLELRAFHREASVLRDRLHGNRKASDSAGQTLEETVSVVESLHERWQAAQRGWFSGSLADMEHKLLLAEDAWKRIRLGSIRGKHGDTTPEEILRCRLESISITPTTMKLDMNHFSSSQSSLDEPSLCQSKYFNESNGIPLYETTSPLSVSCAPQSCLRKVLEVDRVIIEPRVELLSPKRRASERTRTDVANIRVKGDNGGSVGPRHDQTSATLPVRVQARKISKEEIKQKMQEIRLVSESGNASVLEIIEPSGSDPDEGDFRNLLPESQSTPNREQGAAKSVLERAQFPEPDLLAGTFRDSERGIDIPDGRREDFHLPPPIEFDNQHVSLKKKGFFNKLSLKWNKRREKSIDANSQASASEGDTPTDEVKVEVVSPKGRVAGLSQMFEEMAQPASASHYPSLETLFSPAEEDTLKQSLLSPTLKTNNEKPKSLEWEIHNVGIFHTEEKDKVSSVPLGEVLPPAPPDPERESIPSPSSHKPRGDDFEQPRDPPSSLRLQSHLSKSNHDLKNNASHSSIQIEAMSVGTSEDSGIVIRPASSASKSDTLSRPESLSGIYPPFKGIFSLAKTPPQHLDRLSPTPMDTPKLDQKQSSDQPRHEHKRQGRLIGRVEQAIIKSPALKEEAESPPLEVGKKEKGPGMLQVKRIPRRILREEKAMRKKNRLERPWYDVSDDENDDLLITSSRHSVVPSVHSSSSEEEPETV